MKKVIYGGVFLALISVSVIGCKKSTVKPKEESIESQQLKTSLYRTDDKMLIFNTVPDFDAIIERAGEDLYSELKALEFMSYAETLSSEQENVLDDEFLSWVLNKDLAVQIGNYIYKIDKPNSTVYALSVSQASSYADLIAKNTSNKYVLTFSTEDNVFELLGEVESTEKGSNSCRNSNQQVDNWFEYADFVDVDNVYGNGSDKRYKFERKLKIKYDNWGIYRKFYTEFWHNEKLGGVFDETYFYICDSVQYNVKGGGSGLLTHYPSYAFALNQAIEVPTSNYTYYDDHKEVVYYRATKCLKAYKIRAWVWMRNREDFTPDLVPSSGYLRISDGY
jgi:hypothetical protein